jgi:hypothetical protein
MSCQFIHFCCNRLRSTIKFVITFNNWALAVIISLFTFRDFTHSKSRFAVFFSARLLQDFTSFHLFNHRFFYKELYLHNSRTKCMSGMKARQTPTAYDQCVGRIFDSSSSVSIACNPGISKVKTTSSWHAHSPDSRLVSNSTQFPRKTNCATDIIPCCAQDINARLMPDGYQLAYPCTGYQLDYLLTDSKGGTAESIRGMTSQYRQGDGVLAFIGPEDSCAVEARIAAAWNRPMIAFVSSRH